MKTIISTVAIIAALRVCAGAEATLTTEDGTTYEHVSFQRAEPDGLYIEYHPGGSGLGLAKVKYSRLSGDLQKKYSYDHAKAAQYEAQSAEAGRAWVQAEIQGEQAARKELAERSAREDMMEVERLRAMAALREAEGGPGPGPADFSYGGGVEGGWPGAVWPFGISDGLRFDRRGFVDQGAFQYRHGHFERTPGLGGSRNLERNLGILIGGQTHR